MSRANLEFLNTLTDIIRERAADQKNSTSYTRQLLNAGPDRVSQKVGEEGVELALAGVAGTDDELLNEAADLLFHMMVLLEARGQSLESAVAVLASRHAAE